MRPELFSPAPRSPRTVILSAGIIVGVMVATLTPLTAHAATPNSLGSPTEIVGITETDVDGDGVPDERITATAALSQQGLLLSTSETTVELATNTVLTFETSTYDYDDKGRVSLQTVTQGVGDTAVLIVYFTSEYDNRGNLVRLIQEEDSGADGSIDGTFTTIFGGSQRELLITYTLESDADGDGAAEIVTTVTSLLDRRGNSVEDTTTTTVEGVVDSETVTSSVYSARGAILSQTSTSTFGDQTFTSAFEADYTSRGLLSSLRQLSDGFLVSSAEQTYDARGNLLTTMDLSDDDRDGDFDRETSGVWVYDRRGSAVQQTTEGRLVSDQSLVSRTETTLEYDPRGDLIRIDVSRDSSGDGVVDESLVETFTRDARGRVISTSIDSDFNADGVTDIRRTIDTVFGPNGEVLQRVTSTDSDGDGVFDTTVTFTLTTH